MDMDKSSGQATPETPPPMDMDKLSDQATPETPPPTDMDKLSGDMAKLSDQATPETPPPMDMDKLSGDMAKLSDQATPETPPPMDMDKLSMDMDKLSGRATPETPPLNPIIPTRKGARKALKASVVIVVLLGLGVAGAPFVAVKGIETFATAVGKDAIAVDKNIETAAKNFVEMPARPAVNDLLQRVPRVTVALDFRRGEPVRQPTESVRAAGHTSTPVAIASAPSRPTGSEARKDRRDASATVTQQTAPGSSQRALKRSGVVQSAQTSEPLFTSTASAPSGRSFENGDKLKTVFYERVDDVEADKWGRKGSPTLGFQQRPELSGEFAVQEDGTVSLPLLGSFPVANHTTQDVQAALASAFKTITGHEGMVTILSLERPPVYVMGPVQKPGSYKYVPSMTVLHVIALAGGLYREGLQTWQRVEAIREVEKRRGAIETMVKLIARAAVLKSEIDGRMAQPPVQLLELVSESEARKLIADESAQRNLIVFARNSRERALSDSVAAAKQEVMMLSNRNSPLDDLVKLRAEHVKDVKSFVAKGIMNKLVLIEAQSALSDVEQRRREAIDQYAMAQQRVGLLEQDKAKFEADTRSELETEIAATDQQIAANEREFASSEGVLDTLTATDAQYARSSEQAPFTYEIIRQTSTGPVALAADGMTTLQPGDLVRIIVPRERGRSDTMQTLRATPGLPAADVSADQQPTATEVEDFGLR